MWTRLVAFYIVSCLSAQAAEKNKITAENLKAAIFFFSKKVINYPNISTFPGLSYTQASNAGLLPTRPISGCAKHSRRYSLALFTGCCLVIIDVVTLSAAWDLSPRTSVTRPGSVPGQRLLCFDYFHQIAL